MATAPRFWTENYLFTGATLDPSSETTGNPVEALEDQQRTYYWQTAVGWTITDHNNKLDFDLGGAEITATVANGYYSTGAALGTAVTAALEAASAAPVWACTYDSGTHKFTIGQGSAFTIRWSTGTNAYRSIGRSLGYDVTANDTGLTSYLADAASYQSVHYLVITLTATQAASGVKGVAAIGHNWTLVGDPFVHSMSLQSNATNAWSAPTTQATFNSSLADARKYFSNSTHQYWRLVVDHVSDPDGYFRMGVLYLGSYVTSPHCFSDNQSRKPGDFTTINTSMGGAHFANFRSRQRRFSFEIAEAQDAEPDATNIWGFFRDISTGENFLLDFDPSSSFLSTFAYGFIPDTEGETHAPIDYWTFSFQFWEAL